jgi:hypothetical protein
VAPTMTHSRSVFKPCLFELRGSEPGDVAEFVDGPAPVLEPGLEGVANKRECRE